MKCKLQTPAGVFETEWRDGKLVAVHFPIARSRAHRSGSVLPSARQLQRQLNEYFSGKRRRFSAAVDLSSGTNFQRKVWRALQRIPFGRTRTYGDIAREIGSPKAARAVGAACGQNPVPILVPCHRVVAHNKKLGGFSGGLHWKKRLLALESAA